MITPTFAQQVSMESTKAQEHKETKRLRASGADNNKERIATNPAPEKEDGQVSTATKDKNGKDGKNGIGGNDLTAKEKEDLFRAFLLSYF